MLRRSEGSNRLQKGFLVAASLAVLGSLILPYVLPSGQAQALQNGTWVNHATIQIGDQTFIDGKIDGDYTYSQPGSDCPFITIEGNSKSSGNFDKGTLHQRRSLSEGCDNLEQVNLTGRSNFNIYFAWKDSSRIASVSGGNGSNGDTYNFCASQNKYFRAIGDCSKDNLKAGSGQDKCFDYITTNKGASIGQLFVRIEINTLAGRGSIVIPDGYKDFIDHADTNAKKDPADDQCLIYKPIIINLGDPAKAQLAPVAGSDSGELTDAEKIDNECALNADKFAWMLCPIINFVRNGIDRLKDVVTNFLKVKPLSSTPGLRSLWERIRDLANVSFALIFLYIIFANTLSIQIDAYTIKKMLPKLVAATILVQLSYLLSGFIIDAGNVLGRGMSELIATTLNAGGAGIAGSDPSGGWQVGVGLVGGLFAVGAIAYFGIAVFVLTAISALVGLSIIFLTLIIRQLIIFIFVAISPIALASWVLPNTDGFFNFWYKNFIRIILVYPITIMILGAGALIGQATAGEGIFQHFIAAIFPIISFFLIPLAFRFAGGVLGAVTGTFSPGAIRRRITGSQYAKDVGEQSKQRRAALAAGAGFTRKGFGAKVGAAPGRITGFGNPRRAANVQKGLTSSVKNQRELLDANTNSNDTGFLDMIGAGDVSGLSKAGRRDLVPFAVRTEGRIAALQKRASMAGATEKNFAAISDMRLPASAKQAYWGQVLSGDAFGKTQEKNYGLAWAKFDQNGKRDYSNLDMKRMTAEQISTQGTDGIKFLQTHDLTDKQGNKLLKDDGITTIKAVEQLSTTDLERALTAPALVKNTNAETRLAWRFTVDGKPAKNGEPKIDPLPIGNAVREVVNNFIKENGDSKAAPKDQSPPGNQ